MTNGYDNSASPHRKLLAPAMALLLAVFCGLAWWYAHAATAAGRKAAAEIIANVRDRGLEPYVTPRHGQVRWYRRSMTVQQRVSDRMGRIGVLEQSVTIGWRAEIMVSYPHDEFGWLEAVFDQSAPSSYEGQWHRWRLNNEMTSGSVFGGSLLVGPDGVVVTGGLIAEIRPGSVSLARNGDSEAAKQVDTGDSFLPPGILSMVGSVMLAKESAGLFNLLGFDADQPGHADIERLAVGVERLSHDRSGPPGEKEGTITVFDPGSGMAMRRIHFNAAGTPLVVEHGEVTETITPVHTGPLAAIGLAGLTPPSQVQRAFWIDIMNRSGFLPAEDPTESE